MANEVEDINDETNEENEIEAEASAEPTVEVAAPVKRPRGRPKGVKVGPRPVAWSCAANVDGEVIHVRLSAPEGSTEDQIAGFSAEDAAEMFENQYGVEPSVLGPFYDQKGGQSKETPRKRESVSIALPNLTMKREAAIYKGWRGVAYGIEGREDVVYFMFGQEVNPDLNKKKATPTAKPILRTALSFEQASEATEIAENN